MLKIILVGLLSLFFVLNGINHFINTDLLGKYAQNRGLISPALLVRLAGLLLITCGISLNFKELQVYGVVGLSVFLLLAAFMVHKFWTDMEPQKRLIEMMNFVKNLAIMTELIYIGFT